MATQITPTTELQAINTMLSAIGEAPVNSISGVTNVDVSVAINILDETSLSVQSEGWNFNTEYNVTYSIDDDSKIPLPSNCVQQFEQLPEYARRYITVKAARRFAARFIGDAGLSELMSIDEQEAYNNFKQSDSRSEDVNILEGDANTYSIINRPPRRTY